MKKILFIDFEDSFSYNILFYLKKSGFDVTMKVWSDSSLLKNHYSYDLLMLGPGPGHPDDYHLVFPFIKSWLDEGKPLGGVCLGHQIFWRIHGAAITRSQHPIHGQSISLDLDQRWKNILGVKNVKNKVFVQRYNSLAVHLFDHKPEKILKGKWHHLIQNQEILITLGPNVLTYQFHPESVGTTCPEVFFNLFHRVS